MGLMLVSGNIFDFPSNFLVNPVNCTGVMGAGLAKQFKERYPKMFKEYKELCMLGKLRPGKLHWYVPKRHGDEGPVIINFPTKDKWQHKSEMSYIVEGLKAMVDIIDKLEKAVNVSIPALGCGLGGLSFTEVHDVLIEGLKNSRHSYLLILPNRRKLLP